LSLTVLAALEFPPISHLIEWPDLFLKGSEYFAINKVVLLMFAATILVIVVFAVAGKGNLVPTGLQNAMEAVVDFVREGVILETMGPDGLRWMPFLFTIFTFIASLNLIGLIPGIQMPVNARMAIPAMLGVLVWVLYNFMGIKHQGFFGYFKNIMFPPGVPKPIYVLLTPIEFISTILVRPFSLAVRLFANLLAGHLILVSFAVLTQALWDSTKVGFVLPFALLIVLTVFEVLVALLQAYIFTILTAVFIGGAMHPEH
jgi:F-type H+-transporting ATPase subunit a